MMAGAEAAARWKRRRMARSVSPTYWERSSGPLTEKKLKADSVARAWAVKVFAQPGGP